MYMDPVQPVSQNYNQSQPVQNCCNKKGFNFKKFLFTLLAGFILILVWTWISNPIIVTVTGVGSVNATATNAIISLSLSSTDANPQIAIANVKAKASVIRGILKKNGVLDEDIAESQTTTSLSTTQASIYQAVISMAAKTTQVAQISDLVSLLYANGAANVSQPVLSIDNQEILNNQALDTAMKDAKTQASQFAQKNMKLIKKIINVSQQNGNTTTTATLKSQEIIPTNGTFKITSSVSVTYKMW